MRELKFRAWIYYGKRLRKPRYSDNDWLCRFFEDFREDDTDEYGESQCIEQYTGLKDKNGKEIYEGDIVEYEAYGKRWTGKVYLGFYDDTEGYYEGHHYGWAVRDGSLGDFADEKAMVCGGVEVIGNIHENPELLER